jgi:Tfp pilus assembly protein PilX
MMDDRGLDEARGVALVAAVLLVMLLSAIGLGLALTASLEPAIAANFENGLAATNAAEAALTMMAHDLSELDDWTLALTGTWTPPSLAFPAGDNLQLPDGTDVSLAVLTHVANCGHVEPCTLSEAQAVTLDRPWGPNNPQWRVAGLARTDQLATITTGPPVQTVVWVGDDPSETDGNPQIDGGPSPGEPGAPSPGRAALVLRAESFGIRGSHRLVGWRCASVRGRFADGVATLAHPFPPGSYSREGHVPIRCRVPVVCAEG